MFKTLRQWGWIAIAGSLLACLRAPSPPPDVLTVFAAASLGSLLEAVRQEFGAANPRVDVRVELSASRVACLKVASQGRMADVVLSADAELIDDILMPEHAGFTVLFAHNALVLAYRGDSSLAQELQHGVPWQRALGHGGYRIGIANPELAPVGYRALLALRLNDMVAPRELQQGSRIAAALQPQWQRPDVAKLLAPLQAGDLDAAFVYKSEALQHSLPYVTLGRRIDFSDPAEQSGYASVSVVLPESQAVVRGSVVSYGLTIPFAAHHPNLARVFVNHLLSEAGRKLAVEHHLPLLPADQIRVHGRVPPGMLASAER